jgi:signal transduction histidine kinase
MSAVGALRRARAAVFDAFVAAGVAGLTGLGIFMRQTPPETMWLGYTMAAAVLFRRRRPLVTMAVVASAALAQVLLFPPRDDPLPYDLAVLVAMYSTVKYGRRALHGVLAAAVVAIGIVIEVVRHPGPSWGALALWYVAVCSAVWLVGYTVRARQLYVRSLEERASTLERERDHLARIAVADVRAAIARELHDVVAHSLAVMIVQADGGSYAFDTDPARAREALTTVAATGRDALEDMRRLVQVLRGSDATESAGGPATAADAAPPTAAPPTAAPIALGTGAVAAGGDPPRSTAGSVEFSPLAVDEDGRRRVTLDQLDLLVARAHSAGITVTQTVTGTRPALPVGVELAVYRIVQEALTNVLRHAGAGASVRLTIGYRADAVELCVTDDGAGRFVADGRPVNGTAVAGHGLVGMRERVSVHGGQFWAGPAEGGWRVTACIPLAREPEVAR